MDTGKVVLTILLAVMLIFVFYTKAQLNEKEKETSKMATSLSEIQKDFEEMNKVLGRIEKKLEIEKQ